MPTLRTMMLKMLLLIAATMATATADSSIVVNVQPTGAYDVLVRQQSVLRPWFTSGATAYTSGSVTKTTADGSLKMDGAPSTGTGSDAMGAFTFTELSWDGGMFVTRFRQYADAVVFEQTYPKGAKGTTLNAADPIAARDNVSSAFPTLVPASKAKLGYLAFAGDMTGSNYEYGTLGGSNATEVTEKKGICRITASKTTVAKSGAGYSAWTSSSPGSGAYTEHPGDFCDCDGDGSCSKWKFEDKDMTEGDCQQKCTDLQCACYDFAAGGGGHGGGGNKAKGLPSGVTGFGPACLFTQDLSASVVISSFSQFMAASSAHDSDNAPYRYGLQGSITEVEAGFSLSYIIHANPTGGVNKAFESWGDKLLTTYGKSREVTYQDDSLNYLGYSTDNGAFYYYQTEGHQAGKRGPPYTPGKTYEATLIDVKDYAKAVNVPYHYVLLDSWWYYQGEGSGVTNWVGRPDIFPHGNEYLRNQTGWPIMGHNRFWAVDNVYAKQNGGDYDFVVEKTGDKPDYRNFAWPTEQRFWDDLLYNSTKWGLFMYEQDWLDTEYDNVMHLNKNASAARTWLLQMGTAAARNDLTIQYCMSHCRHIMQSVEIPAVTNARASGDYHPGGDQWKPLGTTGIFAWSVAIAPTKDNYWSTDKQTGSSYKDYATVSEPYNRLQAAVSTLSKGPVAPSDKVGASDPALIMKSCAMDGKLLQGDKPAMTLDSLHSRKAFSASTAGDAITTTASPAAVFDADAVKAELGAREYGTSDEIWATHVALDGNTFAVVMGATLQEDTAVTLAGDLGLTGKQYLAFEQNSTGSVVEVTSIDLKKCGKWDFQAWSISPVLGNGWALLGEQSKWVPVSNARFSELTWDSSGSASVIATGHEGEEVEVSWAKKSGAPVVVKCIIPRGSRVLVTVGSGAQGTCTQV